MKALALLTLLTLSTLACAASTPPTRTPNLAIAKDTVGDTSYQVVPSARIMTMPMACVEGSEAQTPIPAQIEGTTPGTLNLGGCRAQQGIKVYVVLDTVRTYIPRKPKADTAKKAK